MDEIKRGHRIAGWILFIGYLVVLTYFLFFAEGMGRTGTGMKYRYNLTLFKEIRRFYRYRATVGMWAFLLNTVGNAVVFIPFGFFVPLIGKRHNGYITVLYGILFSLGIEFTQYMTGTGIFDVDDIFLNACGCVIGYLFFMVFVAHLKRKERKNEI